MNLDSSIYSIDEAPVLPFHPNCRCKYLPATEEEYIAQAGNYDESDIGNGISEFVSDKNVTTDTIAHELFHEIDKTYKLTETGLLSYSRYPNAFRDIDGKLCMKQEYRAISDIIHGCSDGKIFLGYGHKQEGYWKKPFAVERETFAQYGRMSYNGELSETMKGMIK